MLMKPRLVWLVLCLIWGSTWLFIKLGLQDLPPFSFAAIRFLIASLILALLIAARRLHVPRGRNDLLLISLTGILSFTLNYGLVFWGEQYITSGLAALLQSMLPAFGLIIAHYYLPGEPLTVPRIVGVVLGVIGVGVIFSNQLRVSGPKALWGSAALVLSALCAAFANVIVKAYCKHIDPVVLAAGQMMSGLVLLFLIGISLEGNPFRFHWTWIALISLLYLAVVGTVIAFSLYYWLIRNMNVTDTMMIALVTPVVAVFLGMIALKETLEWRTLAGGLLIISGLSLIVFRRPRRVEARDASTIISR